MNIFLDTNTIISYFFFTEPFCSEMTYFIQKHPHENYYFSEHVYNESEYVFNEKQEFLRMLFTDFLEIIRESNEETINMNNILDKFLKLKNNYIFKNKPVSSEYIKQTLIQVWKGFTLF